MLTALVHTSTFFQGFCCRTVISVVNPWPTKIIHDLRDFLKQMSHRWKSHQVVHVSQCYSVKNATPWTGDFCHSAKLEGGVGPSLCVKVDLRDCCFHEGCNHPTWAYFRNSLGSLAGLSFVLDGQFRTGDPGTWDNHPETWFFGDWLPRPDFSRKAQRLIHQVWWLFHQVQLNRFESVDLWAPVFAEAIHLSIGWTKPANPRSCKAIGEGLSGFKCFNDKRNLWHQNAYWLLFIREMTIRMLACKFDQCQWNMFLHIGWINQMYQMYQEMSWDTKPTRPLQWPATSRNARFCFFSGESDKNVDSMNRSFLIHVNSCQFLLICWSLSVYVNCFKNQQAHIPIAELCQSMKIQKLDELQLAGAHVTWAAHFLPKRFTVFLPKRFHAISHQIGKSSKRAVAPHRIDKGGFMVGPNCRNPSWRFMLA